MTLNTVMSHFLQLKNIIETKILRTRSITLMTQIELQSECKSCLWLRAKIFIALKQYQEAILDCNEILELDDCYSWAYATRGDAYLLLEQYNNAFRKFRTSSNIEA